MDQKVICKKITSLLALYIDGKLDFTNTKIVREHLKNCSECDQKYAILRKLIFELRTAYKELIQDTICEGKRRKFNIKEYENFHSNISSYFDNELTLNESLDIKKYMIKFPNARKELEEMYTLHKLFINSSNIVEKNCNTDFSKHVCNNIFGKSHDANKDILLKIASFTGIVILFGLLVSTNTQINKIVREKSVDFLKKAIYVQSQEKLTSFFDNRH